MSTIGMCGLIMEMRGDEFLMKGILALMPISHQAKGPVPPKVREML